MIFALLPVKDPRRAKQRLEGVLAPAKREALARAMFEEVLEALCAARGIDRILVVTSDPLTCRRARERGAWILEEACQLSHSQSADAAARRAMELGAATVLLLPIDVPLVTPAEIEGLLHAPRPGLLVVPSADGTGTNALVRTPPDVIVSCFGRASFSSHLEQARVRGIPARVARPPGLLFDVDTPEDLAELQARAPHCRAARAVVGPWASAL